MINPLWYLILSSDIKVSVVTWFELVWWEKVWVFIVGVCVLLAMVVMVLLLFGINVFDKGVVI